MDIIIKGRGHGKTSDLVRMSAQTHIPITAQHPDYVISLAASLGVEIPPPLSYAQYINEHKGKQVYIDELDAFLRYCGANAICATLTV